MDGESLYKEECYQIQVAVFEVYREMGCGFLEGVDQECLEKELSKRGNPFVAQQELKLSYTGEPCDKPVSPTLFAMNPLSLNLKLLLPQLGNIMHK